jgi:glycosyltransferase involved in cell wall biosynthesis
VLFVADALDEDGGTRLGLRLADAMNRLGAEATMFSVRSREEATVDPALLGGRVLYGTDRRARLRRAGPQIIASLMGAARRVDVIVSGSETGPGLQLAWLAGLVLRRPVVAMVQLNLERAFPNLLARDRAFLRYAYPRIAGVLCVCEDLIPTVHAVSPRPPRRLGVAEPGLDAEAVLRAARHEPAIHLPPGPLIVGVGRLAGQKGFDTLIRAHGAVRNRGRPHTLLLIGEGGERSALQDLARKLNVSDSVRFMGHVINPHAIVARASLFCLPSRFEGLPVALLEALVLGAPIVAADCVAGPRCILAAGLYGDLVPVESVPALAAAIERHLDHPERLARMAAAGQAWAASFTMDECARKHVRFYQALTRPSGSDRAW